MAPYRRKKPAATDYTTDEEDIITYDVEEDELEQRPNLVQKDAETSPQRLCLAQLLAKVGPCATKPHIHFTPQRLCLAQLLAKVGPCATKPHIHFTPQRLN
ncbi:hypothetical protein TNCV_2228561 [Trichonephila clavipes]|nr:hypothetical protein TNCV_2228561 [Trichonephila clavipes]